MKFLNRALRLVRADAHGVMDQLEERSLLLRQHLREAEVELTRKRVRLEALEEEERRIAQATIALGRQVARLDEDVELALAGDKQELARFALKRLLPVRDALRAQGERGEATRNERERIAERLAEQELQFEQLRDEVAVQLAAAGREKAAREARWASSADPGSPATHEAVDSSLSGCSAGVVSDEEVELELLRRRGSAPSDRAVEGSP